jgi:hypothetical protein
MIPYESESLGGTLSIPWFQDIGSSLKLHDKSPIAPICRNQCDEKLVGGTVRVLHPICDDDPQLFF